MGVRLKLEEQPDEAHGSEDHLLILPTQQEHLTAFPSQSIVIHTSDHNIGNVKVAFGVVEFVAVNLKSSDRGYTYKVRPSDGTEAFLAMEQELQFGPTCPVWLTVPGAEQQTAATVLKGFQPSPTSETQYALQEDGGSEVPVLHVGILRDHLKFRRDDSQSPNMISKETRSEGFSLKTEVVDARAGDTVHTDPRGLDRRQEHDTGGENKRRKTNEEQMQQLNQVKRESSLNPSTDDSARASDAVNSETRASEKQEELVASKVHTRRTPQEHTQPMNAFRHDSSLHHSADDSVHLSRRNSRCESPKQAITTSSSSALSSGSLRKTRRITIPEWADYSRFASRLFGDRFEQREVVENQFGCRIYASAPSRKYSKAEIRIEGTEQAIDEVTKIVEVDVAKSVERCDMHRMVFDLALENKHYSVFQDYAVYQLEPPKFERKSWVSIVTLPKDYAQITRMFIGRHGSGIDPIKKTTRCFIVIENSRRLDYIRINGQCADSVLHCRRLVTDRLSSITR